jgi:hypothetical protein
MRKDTTGASTVKTGTSLAFRLARTGIILAGVALIHPETFGYLLRETMTGFPVFRSLVKEGWATQKNAVRTGKESEHLRASETHDQGDWGPAE